MGPISWISFVLVVVGGLNWGLVGFFKFDLVATVLGGGDPTAVIARIVYALVGIGALVMLAKPFIGAKVAEAPAQM